MSRHWRTISTSSRPAQRRLIGRQRRRRFAVGDKLRVHVARVDQFKRQIDFAIADLTTQTGIGHRANAASDEAAAKY